MCVRASGDLRTTTDSTPFKAPARCVQSKALNSEHAVSTRGPGNAPLPKRLLDVTLVSTGYSTECTVLYLTAYSTGTTRWTLDGRLEHIYLELDGNMVFGNYCWFYSIAEKQKCENEAFALRLRLAYRVWRFKCTAYRAVLATAGKSYTLQSVLYWYSIHDIRTVQLHSRVCAMPPMVYYSYGFKQYTLQ